MVPPSLVEGDLSVFLFKEESCYNIIDFMTKEELQKEIESITRQIVEKYKPQKIILFGSAAKGRFTPDSDLDFFIIKEDVPYLGRDRYRELSKMIERDVAVDFVIYKPEEFNEWFKAGDPFLKTIINEGKALYGS